MAIADVTLVGFFLTKKKSFEKETKNETSSSIERRCRLSSTTTDVDYGSKTKESSDCWIVFYLGLVDVQLADEIFELVDRTGAVDGRTLTAVVLRRRRARLALVRRLFFWGGGVYSKNKINE